jgi:hypothetical protein
MPSSFTAVYGHHQPQAVEYMLCQAFFADRMTMNQRALLVNHALILAEAEPWRHSLLREAMLAWRPEIADWYHWVFARGDPMLLWGAGRVLTGIRDALPTEARHQFELLLVAAQRSNSAMRLAGPNHERPSPYEGIFGHLTQVCPAVIELLTYQCYSNPNRFAFEYARDIAANWQRCKPIWRDHIEQAMKHAGYLTRERVAFALTEFVGSMSPEIIRQMGGWARDESGIRRVPALRAFWRYQDALPDEWKEALDIAIASADPAALEALFRPADWWTFPAAEMQAMAENIGDGELALLAEYENWAVSMHQTLDALNLEQFEGRNGAICHGWSLMHLADADPSVEMQHENPCRRLAALLRSFQIEVNEDETLMRCMDSLLQCFDDLPPALKPPALGEIASQMPKLRTARDFTEECTVVNNRSLQVALRTGQRLAREHRDISRRLHTAYPTLYLALVARGEEPPYTDCANARLRRSSQGIYSMRHWFL